MKKIIIMILFLTVCVIASGIVFYQMTIKRTDRDPKIQVKSYQRIVSLSPNITEILFALGLGERIVGVTRFCNYPPEAQLKPRVGGYLDPNYEAILRLKPDVVVLISEFEQIKAFLSELGIKSLIVDNKTVSDILSSIEHLGVVFGAEEQAEKILADIRTRVDRIEKGTKDSKRPKVLIVIERTLGTGDIEDVYVAGRNTFYDELIKMAGGDNAYDVKKIAYPILSAEGIIHLNPDVIFDLIPQLEQTGLNIATIEKDWERLHQSNAIRNHHIYILSQDYAVIPGPRFILFLEELARMIHPEIDWDLD